MLSDVLPWSEEQDNADIAQKRMRYQDQISEIEDSLNSIKERVANLIATNEELPECERLNKTDFELNTEEKERRVKEGQEQEESLSFELRAWQMARRKLGLKIRKDVWDEMEVTGKSIKVNLLVPFSVSCSFLT